MKHVLIHGKNYGLSSGRLEDIWRLYRNRRGVFMQGNTLYTFLTAMQGSHRVQKTTCP